MNELKPNLKFDYVPIKKINIGNGNEDWLRTETFLPIVSKLLRDDDVRAAGGFMVIRPNNYKGAEPFLYPKHYNNTNYQPQHYDMSSEYNPNLYGIQNLKCHFKAQIHDQKCKFVKSQIFKYNDKNIYSNNNKQTLSQIFQYNQSQQKKIHHKNKKNNKNKSKNIKKHNSQFDIISNTNGELISQTQSGRIIKIKSHQQQHIYDQLDKYLDNDDESTSPSPSPAPPIKKRKLNNNNIKPKYQYPFYLKPQQHNNNEQKQKQNNNRDIHRGFAFVIEQIERKEQEEIGTFWNRESFKKIVGIKTEYDLATPEEIPLLFAENICSLIPIKYAIIDRDDVYHFESPLQLSHLSRYGPFSALKAEEIMLGIQLPYVYVGSEHTFFPFHREDMNLFAVNHLLWGKSKLWYCIDPIDHKRVLEYIRLQYSDDINSECVTPLQHKLFWFDPYILLSMGIKVFFIRQMPGDIVITPPGGIHGGLNIGPNFAESINFMTYDMEMCWKPTLSAMLFYMNNYKCDICITHAFLDVNRLAQRLRNKDINIDKNYIELPMPIINNKYHNIILKKYTNADKIISRSFEWKNRLQLMSRYVNSKEYNKYINGLINGVVYPYYEYNKLMNKYMIYPVKYNGDFKFIMDHLNFIPIYNVNIMVNNMNNLKKKYVELKYILIDYGVRFDVWNKYGKFDEKS
eukprot:45916_1